MAAIRCNDCRKFASINSESDPVVSEEEFDKESGMFTAAIRMVNECADCGQELQEDNYDLQLDFSDLLKKHDCPEKETGEGWCAEIEESRRTVREEPPNATRRVKFYGVEVDVRVVCNCEEAVAETKTFTAETKASHLDVLV
jgi:hypothetical protein